MAAISAHLVNHTHSKLVSRQVPILRLGEPRHIQGEILSQGLQVALVGFDPPSLLTVISEVPRATTVPPRLPLVWVGYKVINLYEEITKKELLNY